MSDTDDTDDLLLIPPDFFAISSDREDYINSYVPYFNIVDSLITQVDKLESRINSIEATPNVSFMGSSVDYGVNGNTYQTNLMPTYKRFNSWEELPQSSNVYIESTQSTPQKPRTRFKLNSLPSTPNAERFTIKQPSTDQIVSNENRQDIPNRNKYRNDVSNKSKLLPRHKKDILHEIDSFITNVNTIKNYQAARNLNSEFESCKPQNVHANVGVKDDENKLQSPNSQQQVSKSNLQEKEPEMKISNKPIVQEEFYKEKSWIQGDTKDSVPDYGMGIRDLMYNNKNQSNPFLKDDIPTLTVTNLNSQNLSTSDYSARNSGSGYSDNSPSVSSSDLTQLTAYQYKTLQNLSNPEKIHTNAMDALNKHKSLLSRNLTCYDTRTSGKGEKHTSSYYKAYASKNTDYDSIFKNKLTLLSLSDLWHQDRNLDSGDKDHSKCFGKLQEEKLRRKHCEHLINELHTRTLEYQEKLAVAIQVDLAKDDTLVKIHKSCEEAATIIDKLNKERLQLEQEIGEIKTRASVELSEAAKKLQHYESELSKSLNLAHMNQERLVDLEKQNASFEAELSAVKNNLKSAEEYYNRELEKNEQLSKLLGQKEIDLNESKNILSEARTEVAQSKRAVELCQAELQSIKKSQTQLEKNLAEEIQQAKLLESEKTRLLSDIETYKKIEKSLREDLNKQKQLNEQNKMELRNFYQNQVEAVVRDKLHEFQTQLEKAESSIQDEIRQRELAVAKAAAIHIQQITDKHAIEVHLLEEKHKEEVKLHKLQHSQAQQQIDNLHLKIQHNQERRANIAQQLHKVMEAQWFEAIKIINNSRSPTVPQEKSTNTIDQLNHLKSKSYNNLEEILFKEEGATAKAGGDFKMQKVKPSLTQTTESVSSIVEDDSYNRLQFPSETPVSSRPQKTRQQTENELQKYIQMLLNKSSSHLVDDHNNKYAIDSQEINSKTQQANTCSDMLHPDDTKLNKVSSRDRWGKRPWK